MNAIGLVFHANDFKKDSNLRQTKQNALKQHSITNFPATEVGTYETEGLIEQLYVPTTTHRLSVTTIDYRSPLFLPFLETKLGDLSMPLKQVISILC